MPDQQTYDGPVLAYLMKLYGNDPVDDLSSRLFFERLERSKGLVERDLMQAELQQLRAKPSLAAVPGASSAEA